MNPDSQSRTRQTERKRGADPRSRAGYQQVFIRVPELARAVPDLEARVEARLDERNIPQKK